MARTSTGLALASVLALGACATPSGTKYSVTPQTQVTVRGAKKKAAQANYQRTPEESMRTGAGGGGGSEK